MSTSPASQVTSTEFEVTEYPEVGKTAEQIKAIFEPYGKSTKTGSTNQGRIVY